MDASKVKKGVAKDICEFYSRGIQTTKYQGTNFNDYIKNKQVVTESLDTWLREYLYEEIAEDRKKELRSKVLSNVFFLIIHEAKNWNLSSTVFEEAVQNACIAVVEAMDKFDPSKNVKFSTFIMQFHVIKTAFREAISSHCVVRMPGGINKKTSAKAKNLTIFEVNPDSTKHHKYTDEEDYGTKNGVVSGVNSILFFNDAKEECVSAKNEEDNDNQAKSYDTQFVEEFVFNSAVGNDNSQKSLENQFFAGEIKDLCEKALCTDEAMLTDNEKLTLKHKYGLLGTPVLRNKEIVSLLKSQGTRVSEPRVCQYSKNGLYKLKKFFIKHGADIAP